MNVREYTRARLSLDPEGGGKDVVGELVPLLKPGVHVPGIVATRWTVVVQSVLCLTITALLSPFLYTLLPPPAGLASFPRFVSLMLAVNVLHLANWSGFWERVRRLMESLPEEPKSLQVFNLTLPEAGVVVCHFGPILIALIVDYAMGKLGVVGSWAITVAAMSLSSLTLACLISWTIGGTIRFAKRIG